MTVQISTTQDLARYINVPLEDLLSCTKDRSRFYTEKEIAKASGSVRKLHAVSGVLKDVQRKLLDKLQEEYWPKSQSHGFTKDRSIITNAIPHSRKKLLLKVDLADFFPTIRFSRVKGMFAAPPFGFGEEASTTLAQICCLSDNNGQLPQGGVTSPFVANMICRRLDTRMAGWARECRCHFTRYADDMTFSTNDVNKIDIKKLLGKIYQIIEEEGFTPNKEKTKILTPKDRQIVTGIVVNDGINVNRKYIRNIRATIRNIERFGINSQIVKKEPYKNKSSSRPDIEKITVGYSFRGKPISKEKAALHFLRHVVGRLAFVGQVVTAAEQDKHSEKYRRIGAYKSLLLRFYLAVKKDGRFDQVEKALLKQMNKHESVLQEIALFKKAQEKRKSVLVKFQSKFETRKDIEKVNRIVSYEEFLEFSKRKLAIDPRYKDLSDIKNNQLDINDLKEKLLKLVSSPAPVHSLDATFTILDSLRDTDQLGMITHYNKNTSATVIPPFITAVLSRRFKPHSISFAELFHQSTNEAVHYCKSTATAWLDAEHVRLS